MTYARPCATAAKRTSVVGRSPASRISMSGTYSGLLHECRARPRLVFARYTEDQQLRTMDTTCGSSQSSWT
jgi:hypothetical protein